MPDSILESENKSYFQVNLGLAAEFKPEIKEKYSVELAVCFLTIRDFKNLLFGVQTNLATGLDKAFVDEVLRSDLNSMIINLQNYKGNEDTGVQKAEEFMEKALAQVYTVYSTLLDEDKKNTTEKVNARVEAFFICRAHLRDAYDQLEYLAEYVPEATPQSPHLPTSSVAQ